MGLPTTGRPVQINGRAEGRGRRGELGNALPLRPAALALQEAQATQLAGALEQLPEARLVELLVHAPEKDSLVRVGHGHLPHGRRPPRHLRGPPAERGGARPPGPRRPAVGRQRPVRLSPLVVLILGDVLLHEDRVALNDDATPQGLAGLPRRLEDADAHTPGPAVPHPVQHEGADVAVPRKVPGD